MHSPRCERFGFEYIRIYIWLRVQAKLNSPNISEIGSSNDENIVFQDVQNELLHSLTVRVSINCKSHHSLGLESQCHSSSALILWIILYVDVKLFIVIIKISLIPIV